jgi:putative phosphoribosyl transferase
MHPGFNALLPFPDRSSAGRLLGQQIARLHLVQPLVMALPRGGVPVAVEVASMLHAPLDLLLVRKIGLPGQPEVALAAVVEGRPPVVELDADLLRRARVPQAWLQDAIADQVQEIERRRLAYLQGRPRPVLPDHTVVLVDDGIATGTTMLAAIKALRQQGVRRIVLGVPLAPQSTLLRLREQVDDVVCLASPAPFDAIGRFYEDFHQLRDEEVVSALNRARDESVADKRMPPGTR